MAGSLQERLEELVRQHKTDNDIYHDLMQFRVREILLVATVYDAFILEEEDKLSEKILGEYYQLNLSSAPRITSVAQGDEALALLRRRRFDMVILTMRIDEISPFELARRIRESNPEIPILLLLNDNSDIQLVAERHDHGGCLDKVFVWNGDSKIFLAMIKYIEDKINVVKDTGIGSVRVILLVEDSIRYYSRYLPILYSEIMKQTQRLIADEHLNETKKLLRMRARPKVLMAESYEEAVQIVEQYRDYLLCLISDIRFPWKQATEEQAGVALVRHVRRPLPDLPILIQSAERENENTARSMKASFMSKNAENLSAELTAFVSEQLGFGDFVFRSGKGKPIARAQSMQEFRELLFGVPDESLVYHANRNQFSAWLMARGEIQIARELQPVKVSDFADTSGLRRHLIDVYQAVQANRIRGRVLPFTETLLEESYPVLRLAEGSLGGKGRGMAFLHLLIERCELDRMIEGLRIGIPQTVVIGTEEYDSFIAANGLADLFTRKTGYRLAKKRFLAGSLSPTVRQGLRCYLQRTLGPVCVRSSGVFEDSLSHPFAGIYDTFLLPNNDPDIEMRLGQLESAIKLVYASILSDSARAYFEAISYKIDEEKMAVLLQEVVGERHGEYFYPHFSGVAQSYNYYPVARLKPEDGIAVIALGLGKYVIDGEKAMRFCPRYPRIDFLTPEEQREYSQGEFYALDLRRRPLRLTEGDAATLARLSIGDAQSHGTLRNCLSTWDQENGRLVLDAQAAGPKVVNFAYILKHNTFPLAPALEAVLDIVKTAMGTPVEVEFAVDLDSRTGGKPSLYVLQIKPLLGDLEDYSMDLAGVESEQLLLYSEKSMGNGRIDGLRDLVYVDPERFDRAATVAMTRELEQFNARLRQEGRPYVLLGPGRWGSRDPWLGIPVSWNHISGARVIVEADLPDFKVDPSLGSHFFHNVTSLNIGYFDVPADAPGCFVDWQWLRSQRTQTESRHFVHLRFPEPIVVKMDGRRSISVIYKPRAEPNPRI